MATCMVSWSPPCCSPGGSQRVGHDLATERHILLEIRDSNPQGKCSGLLQKLSSSWNFQETF